MLAYSAAIGVDSQNNIHICAYDDTAPDSIKYITNSSGAWDALKIDNIGMAAGWKNSLAVDSNDKVHILYYDWANDDLKYATNASGEWVTDIVEDKGGNLSSASLAIDKAHDNRAHVVFQSGEGFFYTTKSSGIWYKNMIDASWTGATNSIAIGSNSIHVSYYDGYNGDLKYAFKTIE